MPGVTLDRVRTIVATLFNVPLMDVLPESTPESIAGWDSMGHLSLILQLEEEFGIRLLPEQAEAMTSVAAVAAEVDVSAATRAR